MPSIESITQIPGIFCAHHSDMEAGTGCTVIICPAGAVGGVDVRGGAPATRETDLLRPEETVDVLHAVVLSGGSAFGLEAASGVANELERQGIGLDMMVAKVPIVAGACLFDLTVGDASVRPTREDGADTVKAALASPSTPVARGNVGAGCGCTVGKLKGPQLAMKTGLGEGIEQAGELICGAISAVNACGDVIDPATGKEIAGVRNPAGGLASTIETVLAMGVQTPVPRSNTTISCVVTNARLTKAQATKVAQMSADAYAHTINPTHTTNDGDTVFVMATGEVESQVDLVGILATRALERAIVDAALSAEGAFGLPAARDL